MEEAYQFKAKKLHAGKAFRVAILNKRYNNSFELSY
jgi:hypothetical protein